MNVSDLPITVAGFRFAGIAAGIKTNGKLDLALLEAEGSVAAAGVFTRNRVQAAPVLLARDRLRRGRARAVLVNSGNANACTGVAGLEAARRTTAAVAERLGADPEDVIPASTGVIGTPLPVDTILSAADRLVRALSPEGAGDFAEAIRTTDRWPKIASVEVRLGRESARVMGIAKGAGMIHPDLATTLGFVVTDAASSPTLLRSLLRAAVEPTFNAISVDGDTSTNDAIVLLASGRGPRVRPNSREAKALGAAITEVLGALGESIVRDGEGARHVARIEVEGLSSHRAARQVARTIATSPLVKTALHGCDANWGRIIAAAGRAGIQLDPNAVEIRIDEETIVRNGMSVGRDAEQRAAKILQRPRYTISVRLGRGKGKAHYLTCDLGPDYVAVNASYRS
jgi:glutamate N-acetyltransferase/amino-acid N-acetyltransferase